MEKIQCACPWCEIVHVFDEIFFFFYIYNEVATLKLSADPARIWICTLRNLSRDASKLLFDSDLSSNHSRQQMCFDSVAFL